jgi:hypothetical protein
MSNLTATFKFTDRGGSEVYDVTGEIRIPPHHKIDEMRQEILDRDVRIEELEAALEKPE